MAKKMRAIPYIGSNYPDQSGYPGCQPPHLEMDRIEIAVIEAGPLFNLAHASDGHYGPVASPLISGRTECLSLRPLHRAYDSSHGGPDENRTTPLVYTSDIVGLLSKCLSLRPLHRATATGT
ncbi:hypothetical protein PGT21_005430 [Puccinia graminis f. sp. tritici]|uniref:Uncharacterized protein n=1 Tax=Puccinia graminis f. sp. tritici TaxID=56615 RepID=A0A5B0NZ55_PUCGR|nr:hypothetical protein PGT21_005430 [Puccinia graminis f. sp. tritici]